ncbi:hypothetical protein BGZ61DRAFT_539920 [Ilyonectria robusta]|uniref:uncharacterized protein n=1 Tax=Ilyonectria robusta TaxID=1079257 RepID=UPI001E8D70EA|nr:uncharacterized protein BGZ61DRAFT_539920 [Ilyonectria robusta]KAH8661035.1 hypothetical protein BGZ61DRAFT_539920 [Ilyonectria robusta]
MQFSAVLIAAIACATGALADLHSYAWCADKVFEGINESNPENNDATKIACGKYKLRTRATTSGTLGPTVPLYRGDVLVCNSPDKHIGGDEWNYYCTNSGADMGKAS